MTIARRRLPRDFWANVEFTDSCWLWKGNTAGRPSYGHFWDGSRYWYAHRYAYEFCIGPIPVGFEVDHLCNTPLCIFPDHLEPVTHQENMLRGLSNVAAQNARKECCPQGHPYSGTNFEGARICHLCRRETHRLSQLRVKEREKQLV